MVNVMVKLMVKVMVQARLGIVVFGNGNRGSFPVTVTGPPLITAGHAHRE